MMISRGLFGWSPPHIQPLTPVSEVSEPPESPSPYLENSGDAGPVEVEEEIDAEAEEIEPPPAAVPFSRLFACADRLDWVLMFFGSLAAAAHGTALVVYLHYFAKIIQLLRHGSEPADALFHKFTEVSFYCWNVGFLLAFLVILLFYCPGNGDFMVFASCLGRLLGTCGCQYFGELSVLGSTCF